AVGTEFDPASVSDNCYASLSYSLSGATATAGFVSGSTLANVVFNKDATTVTWKATDAAGNTATCSFIVMVNDSQAPSITCPANITTGTDAGSCSKTLTLAGIGYPTKSDNCPRPPNPVTWSRSDGASALDAPFQFGVTTITWRVTDGSDNATTCNQTININKVNTVTTFTVSTTPPTNPVTQQYSDRVTFTATVTPYNCTGAGDIGGTVTFKIGTLTMGNASVVNGTATLTTQLLETSL